MTSTQAWYLVQPLELISAVPERSHRVHIERVFSLADGGDSLLHLGDMDLLVCLAAVIWSRKEAEGGSEGWVLCYRGMSRIRIRIGRQLSRRYG